MKNVVKYLTPLPLVEALWWFIENEAGLEQNERTDAFFHLRQRVRLYFQGEER